MTVEYPFEVAQLMAFEELEAEIERLRTERDRVEQRVVDYVHALVRLRDELRAEVERGANRRRVVEGELTECSEGAMELRAENERLTLADRQWADHVKRLADKNERLRAAIDEISASLDEYEAHHRHGYTMKCIRRVIARLAIPAY